MLARTMKTLLLMLKSSARMRRFVSSTISINVTSEIYENLHLIITVSFIRVHEQTQINMIYKISKALKTSSTKLCSAPKPANKRTN